MGQWDTDEPHEPLPSHRNYRALRMTRSFFLVTLQAMSACVWATTVQRSAFSKTERGGKPTGRRLPMVLIVQFLLLGSFSELRLDLLDQTSSFRPRSQESSLDDASTTCTNRSPSESSMMGSTNFPKARVNRGRHFDFFQSVTVWDGKNSHILCMWPAYPSKIDMRV